MHFKFVGVASGVVRLRRMACPSRPRTEETGKQIEYSAPAGR
jgi:hypothetical protein